MISLKLSCALMFLLVLAGSPLVLGAYAVDANSAGLAVERAKEETATAFEAVLEAEQAGADVSVLLARLNDAAGNLSRAEVAQMLEDYNATVDYANVCFDTAWGVGIEADALRAEAYGLRYSDLWFRMIGSVLGLIAVGVGSLYAWRLFRRRYYRRVLDMKPEVSSFES